MCFNKTYLDHLNFPSVMPISLSVCERKNIYQKDQDISAGHDYQTPPIFVASIKDIGCFSFLSSCIDRTKHDPPLSCKQYIQQNILLIMTLVSTRLFEPLERIEFGFVLLPDDHILHKIKYLSETVHYILQKLSLTKNTPKFWGSYTNRIAVLPHLTIGQYGLLGCEYLDLCNIVKLTASVKNVVTQKMENKISVFRGLYVF
jgi:hypothetical protein